ncbi:MAG: bifunctional phosphoribosylaminoimidazolecarboxamide formyltransferase/IMP cyclohydrolase [Candidatus Palauibacterales bacterium]|nr:bifunctional phosphoribosylaminoimidazolecarboxamide formyltransferase/IMP cyclohydrolase [Candidatus Palauibacterales bacterium]
MPRAVLSVYDKTGIVDFARRLVDLGYEIVSTGGTARALRESAVPVTGVGEVTGFPEVLDGRVKTLHPAIAAAILARRNRASDMKELAVHEITPIDVVAVNLYPFEETVADPGVQLDDALEQIDIGGPTMLREAAKNHTDVIVVCDPSDYAGVVERLEDGGTDPGWRRALAAKVFRHTGGYDAAITRYLSSGAATGSGQPAELFPAAMSIPVEKAQDLRYGENPDQKAAFYRTEGERRGVAALVQHHGKELSYNNILDLDGALMSLAPFARSARPACAVIKHTTPCGIAVGDTVAEAYRRALATDPISAFGSVIAINQPVDGEAADVLAELFIECLIAPGYSQDAMERLVVKKNLRILSFPGEASSFLSDSAHLAGGQELRGVRGGALLQTRSEPPWPGDDGGWRTVTKRSPSDAERADLRFAWAAIWGVKSNAIVLARDEAAIGIGAGQTSRVDASKLAGWKAQQAGHDPGAGCVLASDAFFPFRDGVDAAAEAGVTAVVQPGGSIRDEEVIGAADEHGLAMVFTGRRLFRH